MAKKHLTREAFQEAVATASKVHWVSPADIVSKARFGYIVRARQHAMWMLHEAGYGYIAIGQAFGHYDHTSAFHGVRAHAARMGQ